jgi:hypothetical protein
VFDRTHSKDDRGVSGGSALDDNDVAGVNYKTFDRSKHMNALARRDDPKLRIKSFGNFRTPVRSQTEVTKGHDC